MSVWDDRKSPLAPQHGEQRFFRSTRVVLHGNAARAANFLPLARTLLGQLVQQDYILGGLPQSSRWVRVADPHTPASLMEGASEGACSAPGSSIGSGEASPAAGAMIRVAYLHGLPLIEIWAHSRADQRQREHAISPLLWLPEGILMTPRHAAIAPAGWGLPDTMDNRGTPGGPLREVLLNHLPGNAYPDLLFRQIVEDLGAQGCMTWHLAPVFFLDSEEEDIGIRRLHSEVDPQVSPRYEQLIREEPVAQWFCHRPQLVRYLRPGEDDLPDRVALRRDLFTDILAGTNVVRADSGLGPLFPPVRGRYTGMAQSILREVIAAGEMAHDSDAFRAGYRKFFERAGRFAQPLVLAGENLAIVPEASEGKTLGETLVQAWVDSPPHYANMTRDWLFESASPTVDPPVGGFLEIGSVSGGITKPLETSGVIASQVYTSAQRWVQAGQRVWEGVAGRVTYNGPSARYQANNSVGNRDFTGWEGDVLAGRMQVFYRGYEIYAPLSLGGPASGLAACLLRIEESMLVRVAYVTLPATYATHPQFVIEDWRLEDIPTTEWASAPEKAAPVNRYVQELAQSAAAVNVLFSPSGSKATVAVYDLEELPNTQFIRHNQTNFTDRATVPAAGLWRAASLRHLSFNDGEFSWGDTQELFVEPVDISRAGSYNRYHVTCTGTYEAYRDFVGEAEVSATVAVDWEIRQIDSESGVDIYAKAHTKIIFPDTSEFTCVDSSMDGGYTAQIGYTTVIRHIDIRHPEKIIYTRHDLANILEEGAFRPTMSQRLFIGAEEVSTIANVMPREVDFALPYYPGPDEAPTTGARVVHPQPVSGGQSPSGTGATRRCYHPHSEGETGSAVDVYGVTNGDVCAATHHASLLAATFMGGATGPFASSQRASCVFLVAPCFSPGPGTPSLMLDPGTGAQDYRFRNTFNAQRVEYNGQYVAAVELDCIIGMEKYGLQGEERFFYRSSLDLESITGVDGLSKNIMPLGVL